MRCSFSIRLFRILNNRCYTGVFTGFLLPLPTALKYITNPLKYSSYITHAEAGA